MHLKKDRARKYIGDDIKITVDTQTPMLKSFKMLLKSLCINISYHVHYDFCIELQKKNNVHIKFLLANH